MFRISLIAVFVAFLGFTSASPDQCRGKCLPDFPDGKIQFLSHDDCAKFCECVYGRPVEMSCPPGLHYSEKDSVCNFPYLVNCVRSSELVPDEASISSEQNLIQSAEGDDTDDKCIGTCPDDLHEYPEITVLLAHEKCHKFCKCNRNRTLIQACPKNLHFSLDFGGCTAPVEANCQGIIEDEPPKNSTRDCCQCPTPTPTPTASPPPADPSGCIGTCPIWGGDDVVHLPHKDCSKFCKCDFGTPHVMSCKDGLHFNPILQVCDRPSQAGCGGDGTTPSSPPGPTPAPPPPPPPGGDPTGCIGTCPLWEGDQVVHLPHKDCTKFCKCDFGTPHVMSCKNGLHFNPKLQVCDRPSQAGCGSDGTTPSYPPGPTPAPPPPPPPGGDPSGCIGTCPLWEGDKVVHLPHKDCTKFCKCDFGTPHVMSCKNGLHFNPKLQVCDRPSQAGCGSDGTTPSYPPGPTPAPPPPPPPGGDPSGCIGTCPLWEGDKVVHLPHKDCTKFCKCDFGTPHVMSCKNGLHFNPKLQVCDRPSQAGCGSDGTTPSYPPGPTPAPPPPPPPGGDPSGCIGTCPLWEGDKVVHLPHKDCTKFCKCDFGTPHVMSCKNGLHFNPKLQVCDRPSQAGCGGDGPPPPHPPGPSPVPPPPPGGDSSGCKGTCPLWEGDKVVHLAHQDCTKFCKCDFGTPHVMSCKNGLHFNPKLQVCDRPSQAGCGSDGTTPSYPPGPTPAPPPPPPPGGDSSGCIGTCPLWEGDQVVHLPHKDCSKFCKCDFGTPHVMSCKNGLHFNPKLQVCDRPSQAGCKADNPNPNPSQPNTPPSDSPSPPAPSTTEDTSGCIGHCPLWEEDKVVHLPHKDCTKFCKCDFGTPNVMSCKNGLHFNPKLQVCDRPGHAGCEGDKPIPTSSEAPKPEPTTQKPEPSSPIPIPDDITGCIGECPLSGDDKVVHLPHKDCTKFCKCDFGTPNVMSCKSGLHFNPRLQVCDRPSQAGCTGNGGSQHRDEINDVARKKFMSFNRLFRW